MENKALRHNADKPKWGLIHYASILPLVKVLMFGAKKYVPDNWKQPMSRREILESMQRHLSALMDGEECDQESGELHTGHIMANAMFWNYHYENAEREKVLKHIQDLGKM